MSEKGFLGRWSKRKRAARDEEAPPEPPPPEAEPTGEADAEAPPAGPPEEPEITEEELARLPPIAEARASAELRGYLRRGVPDALKRAALRRIWMLNPAIRDYVDPALDYAWDFNAPAATGHGLADVAADVARVLGGMGERRPASDSPLPERRAEQPATRRSGADAGRALERAAPPPPAEGDGTAPAEQAAVPRRRHGGAVPRT